MLLESASVSTTPPFMVIGEELLMELVKEGPLTEVFILDHTPPASTRGLYVPRELRIPFHVEIRCVILSS